VYSVSVMKTKVTIVMPTLNQLSYTQLAIESLFRNTDLPFNLTIVDNGSGEDTIVKMKSWSKHGLCQSLKVITLGENRGYPAACNVGMKRARTPYVIIANNDLYFPPNWLSPLVSVMDSDPWIGAVGPASNYAVGEQTVTIPFEFREMAPKSIGGDYQSKLDTFASEFMAANQWARPATNSLVGFCLLIRRKALQHVGFMDERFFPGQYDDVDLNYRLVTSAWKTMFCPASFVYHFGHATFEGEGISAVEALNINRERFNNKWGIK